MVFPGTQVSLYTELSRHVGIGDRLVDSIDLLCALVQVLKVRFQNRECLVVMA
ncbi:hypothetical protein D3C76_1250200 [compost metagenome]